MPPIGWESVTWALPVALVLAVLCWWLLDISRFGFLARFVDANPRMAAAVGIPIGTVTLTAALLSGAISGIGGFVVSAGIESRLTQSFFLGYTFSGILIAFLARNNPLFAILVAAFVGVLFVAGQSLQVFYQIPGAAHLRLGYKNDGIGAHWRAIYDDKGRIMVAICHNMHIGDAWEHADDPRYPERFSSLAYRLGINYIIYSMTH